MTVPITRGVGGATKRKRFSAKAPDVAMVAPIPSPMQFTAHSPAPIITLLDSWPNFTPGGEPCCWNRVKVRKIDAPLGFELAAEKLSGEISQAVVIWGIVGDVKKDDVAWKHLSSLLIASGISRPAHSAVGMMIR